MYIAVLTRKTCFKGCDWFPKATFLQYPMVHTDAGVVHAAQSVIAKQAGQDLVKH